MGQVKSMLTSGFSRTFSSCGKDLECGDFASLAHFFPLLYVTILLTRLDCAFFCTFSILFLYYNCVTVPNSKNVVLVKSFMGG